MTVNPSRIMYMEIRDNGKRLECFWPTCGNLDQISIFGTSYVYNGGIEQQPRILTMHSLMQQQRDVVGKPESPFPHTNKR